VLGRIRLIAPLGQGSMGVVWKGHHLSLDLPVAVKVVRSLDLSDPTRHRERLRREAQMAARLSHPGIVRVLDFVDDGEFPCLVMELVEGSTLDAYLRARGSFPERTALLMAFHLAGALVAAHEAGILHRDIKPANVLIGADGTLKLSDLGLARPLADSSLTDHRNVMGTPLYMAPELFTRTSQPDPRCDLYSLGVVLYQLMTGAPPFGGSTAQVIHGHLHLGADLGKIPEGSRHILSRLLDKEPRLRVGSARELREMLRARVNQIDSSRLPGSGSRSGSLTRTHGSDSRLVERLERHLATESVADGKTIVHTTGRERIIVGILLGNLVAIGLFGWFRMS
jgi:serine/threonine-protein kinase